MFTVPVLLSGEHEAGIYFGPQFVDGNNASSYGTIGSFKNVTRKILTLVMKDLSLQS